MRRRAAEGRSPFFRVCTAPVRVCSPAPEALLVKPLVEKLPRRTGSPESAHTLTRGAHTLAE